MIVPALVFVVNQKRDQMDESGGLKTNDPKGGTSGRCSVSASRNSAGMCAAGCYLVGVGN